MVAWFEIDAGAALRASAISALGLIKYCDTGGIVSWPAVPAKAVAAVKSMQKFFISNNRAGPMELDNRLRAEM